MLTRGRIEAGLGLSAGAGSSSCLAYLCDRPLTIEPVLRPILRSPLVREGAEEAVLTPLRLFRAAVRGLDDLLDGSERDPSGRAAAWVRFGAQTAAGSALDAWERSIEAAPSPSARRAMLRESEAMLEAVRSELIESAVADAGRPRSVAELKALERRIRDKEIAYWRLAFALIGGCWTGTEQALVALGERMIECGHVWQRLDDVRDFAEDLARGRVSSFVVALLQDVDGTVCWREHLQAQLREDGPRIEERRLALAAELTHDAEQAAQRIEEVVTTFGLVPARAATGPATEHEGASR